MARVCAGSSLDLIVVRAQQAGERCVEALDHAVGLRVARGREPVLDAPLGAQPIEVFTSVPDLKRKLMRYIRQYNKQPKPVTWKYFDTSRRITTDSIVTTNQEAQSRRRNPDATALGS